MLCPIYTQSFTRTFQFASSVRRSGNVFVSLSETHLVVDIFVSRCCLSVCPLCLSCARNPRSSPGRCFFWSCQLQMLHVPRVRDFEFTRLMFWTVLVYLQFITLSVSVCLSLCVSVYLSLRLSFPPSLSPSLSLSLS